MSNTKFFYFGKNDAIPIVSLTVCNDQYPNENATAKSEVVATGVCSEG